MGDEPAKALPLQRTMQAVAERQIPESAEESNYILQNVTSSAASPPSTPQTKLKGRALFHQIVLLLSEGNPPCIVAKKLGTSPRMVCYHQEIAVQKCLIKRINDSVPYLFGKGVNFSALDTITADRVSGRKNVTPYCRLHADKGNRYKVPVERLGDVHKLKGDNGPLSLFPTKGPLVCKLTIPTELIGHEGAAATLAMGDGASFLMVSLPELKLYVPSQLPLPIEDPFNAVLDHILGILTRYAGWKFGDVQICGGVHYAFSLLSLGRLAREFSSIPMLRRGQEEADLILWKDNSHNTPELETDDLGVASDIFSMLMVERSKKGDHR